MWEEYEMLSDSKSSLYMAFNSRISKENTPYVTLVMDDPMKIKLPLKLNRWTSLC